MAAAKVLDTYEPLEEILLHISLRELLLSQSVNKRFRAIGPSADYSVSNQRPKVQNMEF